MKASNWLLSAALALPLALTSAVLAPAEAHAQQAAAQWVDVPVGQSFIYQESREIARVLISDGDIAELKQLTPGQFQVRGVSVGSTDLWVWFKDAPNQPVSYTLTVHEDLSDMIRRIDQTVETSPPKVYPLMNRLVVEGPVPDVETLERVAEVARIYDEDFVNLMTVAGDHQIQLEVVFTEVDRRALRELGVNALWGDNSLGAALEGPASIATSYGTRPGLTNLNGSFLQAATTGTFQLLGTFGGDVDLTAVMSVLEQYDVSKTLARPTLVALSGQQAEFLAGGEVPIPVANQLNNISIEFKEYGVKLLFVPTVLGGEVVDMRVQVEVSDIDSSNSVRLTGVEIPAFKSRKSQSHLRLESGMTFAMAGMLSESSSQTTARIPVLGEIPIVGTLFRYVKHERNETELVIFVTPRLVRPMAPGEVPEYPTAREDNNPNDLELFLLGADHRLGKKDDDDGQKSSGSQPQGTVGMAR
ncbi:MAG: pilus assembly protein N-terminal domain-containing protein [Alphaproteobacteria bacterium]|nr:pilus assembly protein N-terminal domain-containing protein [Alphaproteobacteria bacterium]